MKFSTINLISALILIYSGKLVNSIIERNVPSTSNGSSIYEGEEGNNGIITRRKPSISPNPNQKDNYQDSSNNKCSQTPEKDNKVGPIKISFGILISTNILFLLISLYVNSKVLTLVNKINNNSERLITRPQIA